MGRTGKSLEQLKVGLQEAMVRSHTDRMRLLDAVKEVGLLLGVNNKTARDYVKLLVERGYFVSDRVNLILKEVEA